MGMGEFLRRRLGAGRAKLLWLGILALGVVIGLRVGRQTAAGKQGALNAKEAQTAGALDAKEAKSAGVWEAFGFWLERKLLREFFPVCGAEAAGVFRLEYAFPLYGYYLTETAAGGETGAEGDLRETLSDSAPGEDICVPEKDEGIHRGGKIIGLDSFPGADGRAEDERPEEAFGESEETSPLRETVGQAAAFYPHGKLQPMETAQFLSYETLVKRFYTIDTSTMAGSDQLDINRLLQYDLRLDEKAEGPHILIYHTHSQEAFADSAEGDRSGTIVGVGDYLTQVLEEQYGYQVLHHTAAYDLDSRNDAYARALPEIERILEENPGIQVVIDLHRDGTAEGTRLVTDLDGRPTAMFMFFNGMSRTRKTGNISYLENPYQEENLAFSFQLKWMADQYYPGLTRKIYLKGYRYNMHVKPRTLLVELGSQNNTVEEALNACEPLAHILDLVLRGEG